MFSNSMYQPWKGKQVQFFVQDQDYFYIQNIQLIQLQELELKSKLAQNLFSFTSMGGESKIKETDKGQSGICKIDGNEYDEWEYFRKYSSS